MDEPTLQGAEIMTVRQTDQHILFETTVLTELVGGLTSSPELKQGIADVTEPWLEFVEAKTREAASSGTPLAGALPAEDVTNMLFSLVLGLEMRSKIDGDFERADRMFRLARLAAGMLPAITKKS